MMNRMWCGDDDGIDSDDAKHNNDIAHTRRRWCVCVWVWAAAKHLMVCRLFCYNVLCVCAVPITLCSVRNI